MTARALPSTEALSTTTTSTSQSFALSNADPTLSSNRDLVLKLMTITATLDGADISLNAIEKIAHCQSCLTRTQTIYLSGQWYLPTKSYYQSSCLATTRSAPFATALTRYSTNRLRLVMK